MQRIFRSGVLLIGIAATAAAVRSATRSWPITIAAAAIATAAAAAYIALSRKNRATAGFVAPARRSRFDAIRRFLHLSLIMFLHLSLIIIAAGRAEAARPTSAETHWLAGNFVLPDRFYVHRRCSDVSEFAKRLSNPSDEVRELSELVAKNCAAVANQTLSAAEWVDSTEPVVASLSAKIECPNCVNVDLSVRQAIPRNLATYTLLLVPSDAWLVKNPKSVGNLRRAFLNFGRSIGPLHGAIWLADPENGIDVVRSKDYADRFDLDYGDGPYIIFTNQRPDTAGAKRLIVLRLDGIDVPGTIKLLDQIAGELRNNRKPSQTALLLSELKEYFVALAVKHPELLKRLIFGGD
jgi:hypothetical protein